MNDTLLAAVHTQTPYAELATVGLQLIQLLQRDLIDNRQ
jgi:hypothetical protein